MRQWVLVWPTTIFLSAFAAALVNFVVPGVIGRPIIIMWFLLVCPGMLLVRFLRLREPIVEWTLAIALSLTIEAMVAGIQLYAGKWSPSGTLTIIISFCLLGGVVQIVHLKIKGDK